MKELKNKIFVLTFSILTLSILSFILVFNIQNYLEQKNSINNSLNVSTQSNPKNDFKGDMAPIDKPNEEKEPLDRNIKFMDSTIYTVLIDENDNIKEIINHTNDAIDSSKIEKLANEILNDNSRKGKYIGCLYFKDYSYVYIKGDSLTILDNTNIKNSLLLSLNISIMIFIILEILVFIITKVITDRIIKPVKTSFEKQKQFIADASHELKTPLSVIIASSEALEDNPKEQKWLKNIKLEADRMNGLITNLLDLASSEYQETYRLENKDLSKIVELSVLTFEGKAFEHNIRLNYKIDDNIKMNLDENSIKQLIEILLDNAIKHSKDNGSINVILKESSTNIELLVQNEGEPIPSGEEDKIFERFYRIDKSRNRKEGRYGLGLAIGKNIVLNHNGKISAMSSNGITTFKVLFKK